MDQPNLKSNDEIHAVDKVISDGYTTKCGSVISERLNSKWKLVPDPITCEGCTYVLLLGLSEGGQP